MCCIFLQEAGTGHRIPPMSGIHLGVGSWKLFKLIKGGFVKSKNDCKSDPCGWTRRSHLFDTAREGHSHFHTTEQRRKVSIFSLKPCQEQRTLLCRIWPRWHLLSHICDQTFVAVNCILEILLWENWNSLTAGPSQDTFHPCGRTSGGHSWK